MTSFKKNLWTLIAALGCIPVYGQKSAFPEVIRVEGGLISGTTSQTGHIHIYRGIPFAAPPIGPLRWKAPQPVLPWKGIRKCDAFAASPMQNKPTPFGVYTAEFLIPPSPISEDCLYLNVWTDAQLAGEKRPVIVWIYGGGFASGGSGVPIYDGEAMARKGIIFVSINYRVGIFGFFAHPALTLESGRHASGNYGLMDQIAALQWVKKNIEGFGGDPNNVTIAGQSAGLMSVNCLVASPLCKGLFHRAIAESGAMFVSGMIRTSTLAQAEEEGVKVSQSLHDSTLDQLRDALPEDLMAKAQAIRGVIIDGYVLPEPVASIFASGKQNDVPVITGWNGDDGLIFGRLKTAAEFQKQAEQQYGVDAVQFLKYFPASSDQQAAASQVKLSRDLLFGIQNYSWGKIQSRRGKSKIFLYNFNRKVPATPDFAKYGAFHTGEVAYAYDNLKYENRPWTQTDRQLAILMSSYWANFVLTGNPNGKGLADWPAFDTKSDEVMIFDEHSAARSLPTREELELLISRIK